MAPRFDPSPDAFLIVECLHPVQTLAGFTVMPNYGFGDRPAMYAFLYPGGFDARQETYNANLHNYNGALPEHTLLTSVCTGS